MVEGRRGTSAADRLLRGARPAALATLILLAACGEQNRYVLSSAMQVGLLKAEEVGKLREYENLRRSLVVAPRGLKSQARCRKKEKIFSSSATRCVSKAQFRTA